jgi:hypothetical protein
MDFSGEAEQHTNLHNTLDRLLTMIHDARADLTKFDAEAMNALMIEFKDPLVNCFLTKYFAFTDYIFKYTHLDDEVEHIHASKLKEANFEERDILTVVADLEKHAKSHGDPFVIVPFMRRFVATSWTYWPQ